MKETWGALLFLITRSTWNRLARQAKRIKSPRYALALLFGLAYFWFFFFRGIRGSTTPPSGAVTRSIGSIGAFAFWMTAVLWWLTGGAGSALAFQPAEAQFLFSAPLSRRTLLGYRIARAQVQLLFGAIIWTFLIRRWGVTVSAPFRFAAAWGFFSVLSLHRLGTALTQTQPVEGGRRIGLWVGRAIAAAAAVSVLVGVIPAFSHFADTGFGGIGDAIARPPASIALAPLGWLTGPLYATSTLAWIRAFAIVLAMILAHVIWILSMRVRFEEAAATATQEMAKRIQAFRERRAAGGATIRAPKTVRQWLPLRPTGPPAVALVWKNTLALARIGIARSMLVLVGILAAASVVTHGMKDTRWTGGLAAMFIALTGMAVLMGPRMVRNDLRQDLTQLPILKGWPLSGATVVAAEIASPTILLTLFQILLLLLALYATPQSVRVALGGASIAIVLAVVPVALFMFTGMAIAVQNAAALMFPSWVRLGVEAGGVEMIGQNILMLFGSFLVQGVLLLIPAGLGLPVYWLTAQNHQVTALLLAGGVGAIVLGAELVLFVLLLGKSFERLDPSAIS